MRTGKKFGLEVIFWTLVITVFILLTRFPANDFEVAGYFSTFLMGGLSVLFRVFATRACVSPDKKEFRYMHRVARDVAVCTLLLALVHHFGPSEAFSWIGAGIAFATAYAIAGEYRRYTRVPM